MKIKHIAKGLITYLPGFSNLGIAETGGTNTALYCYGVWLRHLKYISSFKNINDLKNIAELGPGDSIGIGLCGLITGAEKYYAFDIMQYGSNKNNLKIFDELVHMFKNNVPIPNNIDFPALKPFLDDYSFPGEILSNDYLEKKMSSKRLGSIRESIQNKYNEENRHIIYKAPWDSNKIIQKKSVDIIISQAVLEHIDDLKNTYSNFSLWLKDNGIMSHQIDFKCHGFANKWNGHWAYSDFEWKLIRGKRKWLINRKPLSNHVRLLDENNFTIIHSINIQGKNGIQRDRLSKSNSYLSNEDLNTCGSYILSRKK